jgi:hypothetical protein
MLVRRRACRMVRAMGFLVVDWLIGSRKGDELVDTILSLTSTTLDVRIVRRGIDLFHIATCCEPALTSHPHADGANGGRRDQLPKLGRPV